MKGCSENGMKKQKQLTTEWLAVFVNGGGAEI